MRALTLERESEVAERREQELHIGDAVEVWDPRGWLRFEGYVAEIYDDEVTVAARGANDIMVTFPRHMVRYVGRGLFAFRD